MSDEGLSQKVQRLRALRDRPGSPAEGRAAARVLHLLLLKYGPLPSLGLTQQDEADGSLILTPSRIIGYNVFFLTDPLDSKRTLRAIEPGPDARREGWILLHARVISPFGEIRHVCRERRALLLAYGSDVVEPGERVSVELMPSGRVSGVASLRLRWQVEFPLLGEGENE